MTLAEERAPVEFELSARYRAGAGPVLLTGVQAIARMLVEQHAADARAGLTTASFVSGYQGSPLGGLDQTLARATELQENARPHARARRQRGARRHRHLGQPGRGARPRPQRRRRGRRLVRQGARRRSRGRPVAPRQHVRRPPVRRGAGARGRRSQLQVLHHPVHLGAHARRATDCRCSTPAPPKRSSDLGRYGVALSRASGMWVGMKITADVADGVFALNGAGDLPVTCRSWSGRARPWVYRQYPMLVPPGSLEAEAQMYGPRWAMVRAFLAANPINTVEVDAPARLAGRRGGRQGVHRRPAGAA